MQSSVLESAPSVKAESPSAPSDSYIRKRRIDTLALSVSLCSVPISIAITEFFLAIAALAHLIAIARGRASVRLPRVFWFWSAWAALEIASWLHSPETRLGLGEMRHLLLLGTLFL